MTRALSAETAVIGRLRRLFTARHGHSLAYKEAAALSILVAGVLVLGAVGAAAFTDPSGWTAGRRAALARSLQGDFSDRSLALVTQGMDPAMLRIARRFDPGISRPAPAPFWAGDGEDEQAPPVFKLQDVSPSQAMLINASIPFSILPNPPARPFKLTVSNDQARGQALQCLTAAVYYEAGSESDEGEAAVAQVVLNRLRHPLFPKTVCGVVFQGATLPTGCQFTFTCDGSLNREPSADGWARAQRNAERVLDGYVVKEVGEATHYHAVYVVPYWSTSLVKIAQIGAHIFYRWNGSLGSPGAYTLAYAGNEDQAWGLASARLIKVSDPEPVIEMAVHTAPAPIAAPPVIQMASAAPVVVAQTTLTTQAPPTLNVQAPAFETTLAHDPRPRPRIAVPSGW